MGFKEDIKHKPSAYRKWEEIRDVMSYHLAGNPPRRIYETRRPLESSNQYALDYRLENFQPITKMPFKTAVDAIVETASHVYAKAIGLEQNTINYLSDYTNKVAGKNYSLKEYFIDFVTRMVEADPNGVSVQIPVHPNTELVADYRIELPDFNTIQNEFIDISIQQISSSKIYYITEDELWYKAGDYLYDINEGKEMYEPYFYLLTKDTTKLAIPYKTTEGYDYKIIDFYFNGLDVPPFQVIGNNHVMEEVGDDYISYHESTYAGSVAIGNEVLGVKSDSQIVDTRFTYPEKYMNMERCGHPGCRENKDPDSPLAGLFVNYASDGTCTTCGTCSGTGKVAPDTSPLGTHWISKSDLFDDDNKFVPPTVYITPPLESPEYLDKKWRLDFQDMKSALFLMDQNMTNQSGESKSFDVKEKVSVLTSAVKNIFSLYQHSLNSIQGYLRGESNVVIITPPDFNIKTSQDITNELSEAKNTSSLYTSELTSELLLKKFGNTEKNRRLIEFLEMNDKLYGMTTDEIVKLKAIYGTDLTIRDQMIHDKGLAVLKKLSKEEDFNNWEDEKLKSEFEKQIDVLLNIPIEQEEILDDPLLRLEAEAKSKLKGTVGGVQGIIQINTAVAQGLMTEESAESLLLEIYGFSKEVADRLIEKPAGQAITPANAGQSPIV